MGVDGDERPTALRQSDRELRNLACISRCRCECLPQRRRAGGRRSDGFLRRSQERRGVQYASASRHSLVEFIKGQHLHRAIHENDADHGVVSGVGLFMGENHVCWILDLLQSDAGLEKNH
jgi:hypothetical protein